MTLLTFLNCYRSSAAEEFLHSLNLQLKSKIVPRRTCSRAERSNAFVEIFLRGMFNFQDIFWHTCSNWIQKIILSGKYLPDFRYWLFSKSSLFDVSQFIFNSPKPWRVLIPTFQTFSAIFSIFHVLIPKIAMFCRLLALFFLGFSLQYFPFSMFWFLKLPCFADF